MTRSEFIDWLGKNEIPYEDGVQAGWPEGSDVIYIKGKPEDIIGFDGRKHKFQPYLRVSHFDNTEKPGHLYTRDCGLCRYRSVNWVKMRCFELKTGIKIDIVRVDDEEE